MAYLTLKGINKIYPNGYHAVHDFNLEIEKGEFIVFVGSSGCGKSTTLRMIAGLEDISSGEFLINGEYANDKGPREREIAMVFQSYALYPQMSVYDNLAFGLTLQGVDEDVIDKKKEFANVEAAFSADPESLKAANATMNAILNAPELAPLTREEILQILMSIQDFHSRAYDWHPNINPETVYATTEAGGYLLRTKIRAAIEFFDQLYQYGQAGPVRVTELGKEVFDGDDVPELEELEEL